jgi:hypothetical protein
VDYAWGRPNPSGLKALGYEFVCRYLSWLPNGKCIDAAEVRALLAAGVNIALNWEFSADDQLGGASAGVAHATEAVRQAHALGYPPGATIYFSADFDVSQNQWPVVAAYQRAARGVCNTSGYRFGVYAGYYTCKWSIDAGIAQDLWQAYAWSGGNWDPRASLRQIKNGVNILGVDCDIDETAPGPIYFWNHNAQEDDDMTPEQNTLFDSLVWRVAALIGDTPIVTGGVSLGERNMLFRGKALVRTKGKGAVYEVDGTAKTRKWVKTPEEVAGRPIYDVADVTVYGVIVGDNPGDI